MSTLNVNGVRRGGGGGVGGCLYACIHMSVRSHMGEGVGVLWGKNKVGLGGGGFEAMGLYSLRCSTPGHKIKRLHYITLHYMTLRHVALHYITLPYLVLLPIMLPSKASALTLPFSKSV